MANYAIIKQKVDDIISNVTALSATGGRIRYFISVFNPSISDKPVEVFKGSNADNTNLEKPQDWNFGAQMAEKFAEHLNSAVSNPSNVKVSVTLKGGGGEEKGKFSITLRDEYGDFPMHDYDRNIVPHTEEPQVQQSQQNMQGLGSLNDLLGMAFGGLGGIQENSGLGAILGVRDQLIRNEYDRRDMQRQYQHEREADNLRIEFERKNTERQINELRDERDQYKKEVKQLQGELSTAEAQLKSKDAEIAQMNVRIDELEAMKPDASIAGVALTGVGAKIAETLLMRHAGTVGKLFGVGKDEMLGMLAEDNAEPTVPTPQSDANVATPVVMADDDNEPTDERLASIKLFFNSLTEEQRTDFFTLVLFVDENRDKLHQMALSISKQQQSTTEQE